MAQTGMLLAEQDGKVSAKKDAPPESQEWVIEKDGDSAVVSGDAVYLKTHSGNYLTVQGTDVDAKRAEVGPSQRFFMEMAGTPGQPMCPGDTVMFRSQSGKRLTVQAHRVHAAGDHKGSEQRFILEVRRP